MTEVVVIEQPHLERGVDDLEVALAAAFEATREALANRQPVLFVLHDGDLLGQGDVADAALACALLGLMRAAALEGSKEGWVVNAVTRRDTEAPPTDAITSLGLSGQMIRLGTDHIGKVVP
jgi:hypothetical protein